MTKSHKSFSPPWIETPPPVTSYRSIFKWGNPTQFKHPNQGLYTYLKNALHLHDEDFVQPSQTGMETLDKELPPRLASHHLTALQSIVGVENVHLDTYSRLRASYGKAMFDLIRLRRHWVENLPDIVLAPRRTEDVKQIVRYCNEQHIPLYVRGGGSSVTRGTEAIRGGVMLDMSVHMNRVLDFNETNQTITVQAGMFGPELERILNHAPKTLNSQYAYTCGHFPQSFEYSSVGGWVVTRGAGQNSTYYGKIEDIVLAQEYVTLRGILRTPAYPRQATGPDFNQIMLGSEGCFGVLTAVTLKVFRYLPQIAGASAISSKPGRKRSVQRVKSCKAKKDTPQSSAYPIPRKPTLPCTCTILPIRPPIMPCKYWAIIPCNAAYCLAHAMAAEAIRATYNATSIPSAVSMKH